MATFTCYLQGTSPTTIEATDILQFAGAAFGNAVTVGQYQDTTHVESSVGANDSSGNSPKNNKFVDSTHVDLGAGSVLLSGITTAQCALKINFSHGSSVATSGAIIYAYDGSTTTEAPVEVTIKIANQGDASWATPAGSGAALAVPDQGAATSHDFFFAISASPTTVGTKTSFAIRMELTYS